VLLADAGYWHQQQMERAVERGIQVLIPPDAKSRKGTRPGWDGGLYAFMRTILASERGGEMRFSPFEAMSQRQDAQITWGHILKASVQRLAFWRR
jgi:hypothetical protein